MSEPETPPQGEIPWWTKALGASLVLVLIVAGPFALVAGYGYVRWGYGFSDSFAALVFSDKGTTVWAPGYSKAAYQRVRVGMTRDEVHRLIGAPLGGWGTDGVAYASYARSPISTHHHLRLIMFENGRVDRIVFEYYID